MPSRTESISVKYVFIFINFDYVCVKLRIISELSRCLLVIFTASLESVLVNKLVVPQ